MCSCNLCAPLELQLLSVLSPVLAVLPASSSPVYRSMFSDPHVKFIAEALSPLVNICLYCLYVDLSSISKSRSLRRLLSPLVSRCQYVIHLCVDSLFKFGVYRSFHFCLAGPYFDLHLFLLLAGPQFILAVL
jgi:hypothetical protein